jgi:uncharacterized protein YdeI (YjbR/CyaY-like superfamily)
LFLTEKKMDTYKNILAFHASTRQAWRDWLEANHHTQASVWLIIYKKDSGVPSVYYPEAVDEALCFGWIDSKPNKRDAASYYQFFSRRNPKSNWSGVNKEKVARLMEAGLMHPAGLAMVELAKREGTWEALEAIEALVLPPDLQAAFDLQPQAWLYWQQFPPSSKRGILEWIASAKKPETRLQRIEKTVSMAAQNLRANHYRQ